jgi:hypothetical protein
MLQRQIETTDHEIDRLVYELYGPTAEEIKIVVGEIVKPDARVKISTCPMATVD